MPPRKTPIKNILKSETTKITNDNNLKNAENNNLDNLQNDENLKNNENIKNSKVDISCEIPKYKYLGRSYLYSDNNYDKLQNSNILQNSPSKVHLNRRIQRDIFLSSCRNYPAFIELSLIEQYNIAIKLESACYNKVLSDLKYIDGDQNLLTDNKQFLDNYCMICYKFLVNADIKSIVGSDEFISAIVENRINFNTLTKLKSDKLCPNVSQKLRNDVKLRQQIGIQQKVSTNYTCPKCQMREVIYMEKQRRSADEPSDIRLECVKCHSVWWK